MRFGVLILAAGSSSRMGTPKLLLPWANTSVLGHLVQQWTNAGASQITAVCARYDSTIALELEKLGFPEHNRLLNPSPELGMFSSIQCGARWDGWDRSLTHFIVALGDQPHLQLITLRALVQFASANPSRICQPSSRGEPRHPVVMPKSEFTALANVSGKTLQEVLSGKAVALCELNDPGLDLDIDTPEDYRRATTLAKTGDDAD